VIEHVRFTVLATKEHEPLVRKLVPGLPTVLEDDHIKVTYDLNFDYIGQTYQRLSNIERLMDSPGAVSTADLSNLRGGKILLQNIIRKIDQISGRIERGS